MQIALLGTLLLLVNRVQIKEFVEWEKYNVWNFLPSAPDAGMHYITQALQTQHFWFYGYLFLSLLLQNDLIQSACKQYARDVKTM